MSSHSRHSHHRHINASREASPLCTAIFMTVWFSCLIAIVFYIVHFVL